MTEYWTTKLTLNGAPLIHLPGMWENWRRAARIGDDDFLKSFAAAYNIPFSNREFILEVLFAPHRYDTENNKVVLVLHEDTAKQFKAYHSAEVTA